jgi:hypothetical protein
MIDIPAFLKKISRQDNEEFANALTASSAYHTFAKNKTGSSRGRTTAMDPVRLTDEHSLHE